MSDFPLNLLDDLVAVEPRPPSSAPNAILLPDWQRTLEGNVIAKGPRASEVEVGNKVWFGAADGMEGVFGRRNVRIMRESDLLAVEQ